jgi:catechol-2,3-dioxygenase
MYIDGINHATLRVQNLDRSDVSYSQVLGLTRSGQRKPMCFYSSGRFTHELTLLHNPGYRHNSHDGFMHSFYL